MASSSAQLLVEALRLNGEISTKDAQLTHNLAELARVQRERDEARAEVERLRCVAEQAHDALSNLRVGRWEIGYVKDRVDNITLAIRAALAAKQKEGGSRG
jgi:hypothetical protein